jgi:hypothetical protein
MQKDKSANVCYLVALRPFQLRNWDILKGRKPADHLAIPNKRAANE